MFGWFCSFFLESIPTLRKLKENQRLLKTVFDTIPHFVMVKNLDLSYKVVNKAFASSYGTTPSFFKGKTPLKMGLKLNEVEKFEKLDREVIRTGKSIKTPYYEVTYPDGRIIAQRSVRLPLKDKNGKIIGVVIDVENITEMTKLQKRVKYKEKVELVGKMAQSVAHEFTNILQIIKSQSENMKDGKGSFDWSNIFNTIDRGQNRVKELQDFIELGKNCLTFSTDCDKVKENT